MRYRRLIRFLPAIGLLASCGGSGSGGGAATGEPPSSPTPMTAIALVQGDGASSPLVGSLVTVSGVVTGDFQDNDANSERALGGFFVQSVDPDSDAATSEGIFVFDGASPAVDVEAGDRVEVSGEVLEYFGETQIRAASVSVTGREALNALDVMLPLPTINNSDGVAIADMEALEGMLVRFVQPLTVNGSFLLERYGELRLAAGGRSFQLTNQVAPGVAAYTQHVAELAARSLLLDDGNVNENVWPVRYLFPQSQSSPGYALRLGDTVSQLTGNIRFSRASGGSGEQNYRLVPNDVPQFSVANPRPSSAPDVGGNITVASMNVLNFFTTLDTGARVCGPTADNNCRGANTPDELTRQRDKIITAIAGTGADIVGLIELENNADTAIRNLVDALNNRSGENIWNFVDTGTIGDDAIRVAFIYREDAVSAVNDFAILDSSVDGRFDDRRNRPVLLQTFAEISSGSRVNVAVAHLKSKGSDCDAAGDPNTGDGQANCNLTRTAAAVALADWVAGDPTGSNDSDVLVIGDLNAYLEEGPLSALEDKGMTNLLASLGPQAYSFVFQAQAGALDHALVTASLLPQVAGIEEWHINADEAPALDYNLEHGRDSSVFDAMTPYRSSDHDPLMIGLSLTSN